VDPIKELIVFKRITDEGRMREGEISDLR